MLLEAAIEIEPISPSRIALVTGRDFTAPTTFRNFFKLVLSVATPELYLPMIDTTEHSVAVKFQLV